MRKNADNSEKGLSKRKTTHLVGGKKTIALVVYVFVSVWLLDAPVRTSAPHAMLAYLGVGFLLVLSFPFFLSFGLDCLKSSAQAKAKVRMQIALVLVFVTAILSLMMGYTAYSVFGLSRLSEYRDEIRMDFSNKLLGMERD